MSLLSFCPSDIMKQFLSVLSPPSSETLTLHNLNIFSPTEKQKMLCMKKRAGLLPWPHLPAPLRCFQTCIFPPPLNIAGILAVAAGSPEDTAALGKQPPFSAAYLLRWRSSRNHERWNITEKEPQNRFMMSFNAALFTFSFWTRLSCIETRQKKKPTKKRPSSFLLHLCDPPSWKGEKKNSQLEWTAVASSVCGVYLTDCWVKEKAEWDHVLQQPGLETYTCAEVRQLMQRRNPGGGHACRGGAGCQEVGGCPAEGTVRSFGCHQSIHPDGGFILEFPATVTRVDSRERAALAARMLEWTTASHQLKCVDFMRGMYVSVEIARQNFLNSLRLKAIFWENPWHFPKDFQRV